VGAIGEMLDLEQFVPNWGFLFSIPGQAGGAFRSRALVCCGKPTGGMYLNEQVTPFEIRLPAEAPMLPHIVNAAIETEGVRTEEIRRTALLATEWASGNMREVIAAYVKRGHNDLQLIVADEKYTSRIRAAALICLASVQESAVDWFLAHRELVNQLYNRSDGTWYPAGICRLVTDGIASGRKEAFQLVSQTLDLSRTDFAARRRISGSIRAWREFARAPVKSAGRPELWE
jgi:hypothetical protein